MTSRYSKAVVRLYRNTTWRCGKIQKAIVIYLRKKAKPIPLSELIAKFSSITPKGRESIIRAVQSLAKRNIVGITGCRVRVVYRGKVHAGMSSLSEALAAHYFKDLRRYK